MNKSISSKTEKLFFLSEAGFSVLLDIDLFTRSVLKPTHRRVNCS